jgi:tagaturonate reductase
VTHPSNYLFVNYIIVMNLMRSLTKQLYNQNHLGELREYSERAIQFGEGNFLRAFVDWMIDGLNQQGLFQGRVVVVQPIEEGTVSILNQQDGLYTLLLRGIDQGKTVEKQQVVTSIHRGLNPYINWDDVLACARNLDIRFLFSNTTEAGIAYVQEDYNPSQCPTSFPGKVAAYLYERFTHFNGDARAGMIVIPCELIDKNGTTLQSIVLQLSDDWGLSDEFKEWIKNSCYFLNTLVDRIVPGYPQAEDQTIFQSLGYSDRLLDVCEYYHLWVIEGPETLAKELPFQEAGFNVVWTNDLSPYRTRKVRILNGAHTASALAAYLAGIETVHDMMKEPLFEEYLRSLLYKEIMPTLSFQQDELVSYAESVLERFRNPFIHHELLSISLNSFSKWKVRVLPSLIKYIEINRKVPPALAFSLVALIRFYRCKKNNKGKYIGFHGNEQYTIRDNQDVLQFMENQWNQVKSTEDVKQLVKQTLSNEVFWDEDISTYHGLVDVVTKFTIEITEKGIQQALLFDNG